MLYLPDVGFYEWHEISPGPGGVKQLALVNEVGDGGLAGGPLPLLVTLMVTWGLGSPLGDNIGAGSEVSAVYLIHWSKQKFVWMYFDYFES